MHKKQHYLIRDFEAADVKQLAQLWPSPGNPDEYEGRLLLQGRMDEPLIRSVAAVQEGLVIAAGAVAQSRLHPERLWTYIEVEPSQRRKGIGTALLLELEEQLRENNNNAAASFSGLRAKVPAVLEIQKAKQNDDASMLFAEGHGFAEVQAIKTFRVFPGAFPLSVILENDGITVEELATGSVELTQVFWDFYQRTHAWDAPAQLSLGWVQQLFLGPDSGAYGALVVRSPRKNVLAFAVSYASALSEATKVVVGYVSEHRGGNAGKHEVEEALYALLGLLVHRDPIELEVPQAAGELHGILESLSCVDDARVRVIAQDKIVLKLKEAVF